MIGTLFFPPISMENIKEIQLLDLWKISLPLVFFPQELNKIFLSLTPKIENPENFVGFWLISLCNMVYKAIMKLIANSWKVWCLTLSVQKQNSFFLGRKISNNIIIAQEIIHSMKKQGYKQ